MRDETNHRLEGCTAWLADGLDLQQSQYVWSQSFVMYYL
jgi:hypothetical protein